MKFKIGDRVTTHRGDGVIVYIDRGDQLPYLVKVVGYEGHNGSACIRYVTSAKNDKQMDKVWCRERELALVEEYKLRDCDYDEDAEDVLLESVVTI